MRVNRHGQILKNCLPFLEHEGYQISQFHQDTRMPRSLKGLPDVYIMFGGVSWWIEVKPLYANYMRDQMSDVQWKWFHERQHEWCDSIRYAIVVDEHELLDFVLHGDHTEPYRINDYHYGRYSEWRKGR